jgi:hypothetical protein
VGGGLSSWTSGFGAGIEFCLGILFRCRAGGGGAEGRSEDGGKVGLPALEVALAFPQATPASLFPPAGEISRSGFFVFSSLTVFSGLITGLSLYV